LLFFILRKLKHIIICFLLVCWRIRFVYYKEGSEIPTITARCCNDCRSSDLWWMVEIVLFIKLYLKFELFNLKCRDLLMRETACLFYCSEFRSVTLLFISWRCGWFFLPSITIVATLFWSYFLSILCYFNLLLINKFLLEKIYFYFLKLFCNIVAIYI
jgi:hypothetical protein